MKAFPLFAALLLAACSPPARPDGGVPPRDDASQADSIASDASEPVAPYPTELPFSFVSVTGVADAGTLVVETATVSPSDGAEYRSALSAPCIYTSQTARTGTADPALYEQFADRFELQFGTQDVVEFDATALPPSTGGALNVYRPDLPVTFTAHSSRWSAPWRTTTRVPATVRVTAPSPPPLRWNRNDPFVIEWDTTSAPHDADVELVFVRLHATYDTLRCSVPASRGAMSVNFLHHPEWFRRIMPEFANGGYEAFVVRRKIERDPAGGVVMVESRIQVLLSETGFVWF
jgi:hypothetical protein